MPDGQQWQVLGNAVLYSFVILLRFGSVNTCRWRKTVSGRRNLVLAGQNQRHYSTEWNQRCIQNVASCYVLCLDLLFSLLWTLPTLQDFNLWRCSVLLMVTVETVVPALFGSLTRSSRVVLCWYSTRRDLAWSPSLREIDSHLEFRPFSNKCANSCCLLTKLFAYCPVAHPSLV